MKPPAGSRIYLDANILIFLTEGLTRLEEYLQLLDQAFYDQTWEIYTSRLTMLECLVKPLVENNQVLAEQYQRLLEETEGIHLVPVSDEIVMDALQIRVAHNLPVVDAIHAATAKASGCAALVTDDITLRRYQGIPVMGLADLFA